MINFLLFNVFIWGFLFWISFTSWTMLGDKQWIGLANYWDIFADAVFRISLFNTISYVVMFVLPLAFLSLMLGVLVDQKLPGVFFFRACYYLPVVTTVAIIAMIWIFLVKPTPDGIFNYILGWVGIPPQRFLLNTWLALPTLAALAIWHAIGYYMLLWIAGLTAIPTDLYEAARMDGASRLQLFRFVTVPMLRPTTTFILIIATIRSFQMFGPTYLMTGGGPSYSTMTLVYHLWVQAFEFYRMGRSAAISVILFVIILGIALVQRRVMGWDELY
ncbi:sugar ABC transporter permease [Chloroflexi bacterium TSY]|nr:sugar ABC transporter permease [Chloroflexi bacterium TSY]